MKHLLSSLFLICTYVLCGAQVTSLTVDNKVAGTLSQRILYDDKLTVKNITISGELNADDFAFIKELNKSYNLLGIIDLTNTTVVSGGRCLIGTQYEATENNTLSVSVFETSRSVQKLIIPHSIDKWENRGQYSYNGGNTAYNYSQLNCDTLIINCPNLTSVGNGIGTPKYIYFGEGIIGIQIYSYGLTLASGEYNIAKFKGDLELYLPSTIERIYGHSYSGSPNVTINSKITNPERIKTNGTWYNTFLSKGVIYAPADTKESYLNSIFKNLTIVAPVSVKNITLSKENVQLKVGENISLLATIYPDNADNKDVVWSSSDDNIATVDANGLITAHKGGNAKIVVSSAENPNIKVSCNVSIIQPVTGIVLNTSNLELIEDASAQLNAMVLPEDASNKDVNWTSSDVSVAMVSPDGNVYAIKPGQATIMATTVDGGFVALCKITVKPKEVIATAIRLSKNDETLAIGEALQLNAVLEPDNVTNKTIRWTSTNSNIATVNSDGLVKALTEGSTQIIATTTDGSNLSAICNITVEKQFIGITQIQIDPSNARIPIGKSIKLNVLITPNNASSKNVLWSSTNTSVAKVSQDGEVIAIAEGEAFIIASTQDGSNLSATCNITVHNDVILVSEIILNPNNIEGEENETATINAIIIPEDATNKQLRWYSSNDDIAVVNDGIVKLVKKGSAVISAEAVDGSNVKSECTVIVSDNAGIGSIIEDENAYVKIFNLRGHFIYEGIFSEAKIPHGIYIVLCNGKSYKTKID